MSVEAIQQKMELLKMTHTSALALFEKVLSLEVEAREERGIAASLKILGSVQGDEARKLRLSVNFHIILRFIRDSCG